MTFSGRILVQNLLLFMDVSFSFLFFFFSLQKFEGTSMDCLINMEFIQSILLKILK